SGQREGRFGASQIVARDQHAGESAKLRRQELAHERLARSWWPVEQYATLGRDVIRGQSVGSANVLEHVALDPMAQLVRQHDLIPSDSGEWEDLRLANAIAIVDLGADETSAEDTVGSLVLKKRIEYPLSSHQVSCNYREPVLFMHAVGSPTAGEHRRVFEPKQYDSLSQPETWRGPVYLDLIEDGCRRVVSFEAPEAVDHRGLEQRQRIHSATEPCEVQPMGSADPRELRSQLVEEVPDLNRDVRNLILWERMREHTRRLAVAQVSTQARVERPGDPREQRRGDRASALG